MTKLKRKRVLSEMSQAMLADLSGVTLYRIQRAEYMWSKIRPDEAKKISKVLNCKPKELMED